MEFNNKNNLVSLSPNFDVNFLAFDRNTVTKIKQRVVCNGADF